jgi:allophanate hydrolase subunit 2
MPIPEIEKQSAGEIELFQEKALAETLKANRYSTKTISERMGYRFKK